jgi:hypothetical protein
MEKHIEALQLFNEKADKLLNSAFVRALASGKTEATISGHRQDNGSFEISSELRGPPPEAVEAFVLTFRFFVQDNETTSLRNIATMMSFFRDSILLAMPSINSLIRPTVRTSHSITPRRRIAMSWAPSFTVDWPMQIRRGTSCSRLGWTSLQPMSCSTSVSQTYWAKYFTQ